MEQDRIYSSDDAIIEPGEATLSEPRAILTLIHGTFARDAPWTKEGSPFRRALKDHLGRNFSLRFNAFHWKGGNNLFDRHDATEGLRTEILKIHARYPDVPHFLIAHSHAGNVATSLFSDGPVPGVTGIACMATPFFNLRFRSELLDMKLLGRAWTGLLALIALAFSLILGPPLWAQLLIMVGCVLLGGALGAYISGAFENLREGCERLAKLSKPDPRIPMLIIRGTGDEASFVLGFGQMIDWLTQSLYRRTVRSNGKPDLRFTPGRWRLVLFVWIFMIVIGLSLAGFVFIIGGMPSRASLAVAIPLSVALIFSFMLKTNWFDNLATGVATMLSMISNMFMGGWFGTKPPTEIGAGWFGRQIMSAGLSMLLEVRTEATPLGSWSVIQLGPASELPDFIEGQFAHSVYDRPDALKIIGEWIACLSRS